MTGGLEVRTRPVEKSAGLVMEPPRLPPTWMSWVPAAAIFWALAYTALRVWWAINGSPSFGPQHADLIAFTGWGAVGLCAAAVGVAVGLKAAPWWRPLLVAAWTLTAVLLVASALLLLDAVGALLPGLGIAFEPVGFASRAGCALVGALVAASAVAYRRRWRSDCLFCGRTGVRVHPVQTHWWGWLAAYAAVAGCLVRLGAQIVAGFERFLLQASLSLVVFEVGFVVAGTLLPLALVHAWGRVFPRWVPVLAGRRVPRWLVAGPAFGIGGAMTGYFGFTLVMLAVATLSGTSSRLAGSFPLAFFWIAVPAYFTWGVGLLVAAVGYYRVTRPLCRICGQ